MRISAIAVLTAAVALPSSLVAQSATPITETGQITYSIGKVSVQPGGKGNWIKARPGLTLAVGDNVWADVNSEVEIYAGSTVVMVAPETSVAFDELDEFNIKLNLRLGSVIVRLPAVDETKHCEIGTPNLKFMLSESGGYRLDVNAEGNETDVTANEGHGQAIVESTSYTVAAGQQIRFKTRDHLEIEAGPIPDPDSFDVWAASRNQPERHEHEEAVVAGIPTDSSVTEAATRRVWESNGDAGHWVYTEDYGPMWVPTHWSELIVLPPQPVAVVLMEPEATQEIYSGSSGRFVVLDGVPKSAVNWQGQDVSGHIPSHTNNRTWTPAIRTSSGSSAVQSSGNVHQAPPPAPHKSEPPNNRPPKPSSPPSDKTKK